MRHRLLVIDDSTRFSDHLCRAGESAGFAPECSGATSAAGHAQRGVEQDKPFAVTIIVADDHGRDAARLVNELHRISPGTGFIVAAGSEGIDWSWVSSNIDSAVRWTPLDNLTAHDLVSTSLNCIAGICNAEPRTASSPAASATPVGGFLADASAALRSPVDEALRFAELLEQSDDMTTAQRESIIRTVLRSTEQLSEMIDDLMDIAQLETGAAILETRSCSLQVLLDHVASCVRSDLAATNETLVLDVDSTLPDHIDTDALRLGSLLMGLIETAINQADAIIHLRASWYDQRNNEMSLTITGLPEGEVARERLVISRRIAALLGARLEVSMCGDARLILSTSSAPALAGTPADAEANAADTPTAAAA